MSYCKYRCNTKKKRQKYFIERRTTSHWPAPIKVVGLQPNTYGNNDLLIDYNKLQSFGSIENTLGIEPMKDKFLSFGWNVYEVDGHNYNSIEQALLNCKSSKGKPKCIIANTLKGKGISFMENKVEWHYKNPNKIQFDLAVKELTL